MNVIKLISKEQRKLVFPRKFCHFNKYLVLLYVDHLKIVDLLSDPHSLATTIPCEINVQPSKINYSLLTYSSLDGLTLANTSKTQDSIFLFKIDSNLKISQVEEIKTQTFNFIFLINHDNILICEHPGRFTIYRRSDCSWKQTQINLNKTNFKPIKCFVTEKYLFVYCKEKSSHFMVKILLSDLENSDFNPDIITLSNEENEPVFVDDKVTLTSNKTHSFIFSSDEFLNNSTNANCSPLVSELEKVFSASKVFRGDKLLFLSDNPKIWNGINTEPTLLTNVGQNPVGSFDFESEKAIVINFFEILQIDKSGSVLWKREFAPCFISASSDL